MRLAILVVLGLLSGLAYAATGDITAVEISPSGAEPYGACADITIDGFTTGKAVDFGSGYGAQLDYDDLGSAKIVFTVVSEGYDSTGTLGTVTRTIYATSVVRKPYPDDADDQEPSATVIRVALSDFVYDDDNTGAGKSGTAPTVTIAAGAIRNDGGSLETSNAATNLTCTNSSTLDYPQTIARWDRVAGVCTADRVTAAFTMACRAYNRSGIACVRFDATGQTSAHNENSTATTRTATQRVGSSLWAEAYHSASTPLTSFTDDELIDLRFRAYPVVGDADSIRDTNNHTTSTEECLGYNKATIVCDKDNDSTVYAVVNSTTGNNTTGVSSATLATAEASPYLNIFEAIKDGANVIYLLDGTHDAVGGSFTRRTTNEWVVVTYHPTSSSKAGAIVQATSTNRSYLTQRLQYKDLTFRLQNTTSYMDGADAGNFLRLTGINFDDDTTGAPTTGLGYRSHATYLENCTGDMGEQEWDWQTFSTAKVNYCFDGCAFGTPGTPGNSNRLSAYEVVASKQNGCVGYLVIGANTGGPTKDHIEVSFNFVMNFTSSSVPVLNFLADATSVSKGIAIVGNVIEKNAGTSPLAVVAGDGSSTDVYNVLLWHNTFTGERYNAGYNDSGSTARLRRNWSQKYNAFRDWNNKDDTFATANAARTGSWPIGYGVGFQSNHYEISNFPGEYGGLDLTTGTPGYVDDKSYTGSGTGNGDYTPDTGSALLARIPSGQRVVTIDLFGNEVVDGGDLGAIQVTEGVPCSGGTGLRLFGSNSQSSTTDADWNDLPASLLDDPTTTDVVLDDVTNINSETITYTGADLSDVPTGAASYTVTFWISRTGETSAAKEINDLVIRFRDGSGTLQGDNLADLGRIWPGTAATVSYTLTGYTPNGGDFTSSTGLDIQATAYDSNGAATAEILTVWIEVGWSGLPCGGSNWFSMWD